MAANPATYNQDGAADKRGADESKSQLKSQGQGQPKPANKNEILTLGKWIGTLESAIENNGKATQKAALKTFKTALIGDDKEEAGEFDSDEALEIIGKYNNEEDINKIFLNIAGVRGFVTKLKQALQPYWDQKQQRNAPRSNIIIGVNGGQTLEGEADEKQMRDVPKNMVGKQFTIVVKGPRTHDKTEYPIEYGEWSSRSTEIYDILSKGVPNGCKLVDGNSKAQTQNQFYIKAYDQAQKQNESMFDVWIIEDNGLKTTGYYQENDKNSGKKDSKLKDPAHPILFTAIVLILNFYTFAIVIVVYLLAVACLLELNYSSRASIVLGAFFGFLSPVIVYAWKQGPALTHELFEKYRCAVFLDYAPDDMKKNSPMIMPLIYFWDHHKWYFLGMFIIPFILVFGHFVFYVVVYIIDPSVIPAKDVSFWSWMWWIVHGVFLFFSCGIGACLYGKEQQSSLLERQTSSQL